MLQTINYVLIVTTVVTRNINEVWCLVKLAFYGSLQSDGRLYVRAFGRYIVVTLFNTKWYTPLNFSRVMTDDLVR
jgi:hypothetical protein